MSTPAAPPSLALLAAIIDSSEDAIVSKNLQSIVTSWNKGAERIFGYTAADMIGTSIARLFPPDRLEEETHILSRISRGERVEHFETIRVRKDGKLLDVALTISPIRGPDGSIIGASKIARDITEQKTAVRKLSDAHEALTRADRLKSEFVATLSHELRTPLNAIYGWLALLKEDDVPPGIKEGLEVIERNVKAQSRLIEDLLDISRIESGKMSIDLQKLDLLAVVETAIQTIHPTAEAKGVRLIKSFSSINGGLLGDRNRLQQILWNLLTNAVKFTKAGGRIHVVVERVDSHVQVSVIDSGQGIPPEFLHVVFDRFRQVDASTTRKYGGLGLGLSIAKHLAELHGGSLRAFSEGIGTGSTFTLQLPLVAVHAVSDRSATARRRELVDDNVPPPNLQGVRVLVVDDDADSLDVVSRILRRIGATVSTAPSVEDALRAVPEFRPHVVLSDIGMPEHDGYELIARLRALPGGRGIPAIALSALARSEDRTRALRTGFQMHVAKPVDSAELIAAVQNLAALRLDDR